MKSVAAVVAAACGLLMAAGPSQAQVKEQTFRFATVNPAGHPIVIGMEKVAEIVGKKSGGKMTVKLFPGSVLGGDVQVLASLQGGTIDFTSMNSGILQTQVKEFAIVDFPFLFNNAKEADAVMDGATGKKLADMLPAKGLVNLAFFDLGFRNITNSRRPINKLEDVQGIKLRVLQSAIYVDTFQALGANTVPMAFGEVYTALEQRTIDGQENPNTVILANKLNEVQKYLTVSRHIYNPQSVLISKKTWDRLSKEEQDIIASAAKEAAVYQRQVSRDAQDKALEQIKKTTAVNELSPAEMQRFRDKVKPVVDKYAKDVGEDLVKAMFSEIQAVRGK
jgi:tripartite ATP-independent transporter DctP family solute receptor